MITEKITYGLLVAILIYMVVNIEKKLEIKYFKEKMSLGNSKFFFLALIFPRKYFKRDAILNGWLIYLLNIILIFLTFYFFIKLIGGSS